MTGWDSGLYQDQHSFVWRYGASLVELLAPQPAERILDLGCGTGQLTAEIARYGAQVIGLDNAAEMLADARKNYPGLTFVLQDAADFAFAEPFDAVFSNAALHWVKNAEGAAASIAHALRPGGRFVAELGGKGNIASVQLALRAVLGPEADRRSPWYFPSIGDYAALLERHSLEVRNAILFDRPTKLEGENGMDSWLRMFTQPYLSQLSADSADRAVRQLVDHLRPSSYQNGAWTVDYRRLRIVSIRTS